MEELSRIQKTAIGVITVVLLVIELLGFKSSPYIGISILLAVFIACAAVIYMRRKGVSGIEAFHPHRNELSATWWEQFFGENKSPQEVLIMGQSILKTFASPKQAQAFVH